MKPDDYELWRGRQDRRVVLGWLPSRKKREIVGTAEAEEMNRRLGMALDYGKKPPSADEILGGGSMPPRCWRRNPKAE